MPNLPSAFNAGDHDEPLDFSAIPPGDYEAEIESSEVKDSKNNSDNKYWKLTFNVLTGEFKGRKLWKNLNLINANPKAVEIANSELSQICTACGKASIGSTEELHKIPMLITVKVTPATAQHAEGNDISKCAPLEGLATPSAAGATNIKDAAPATRKPWEK